ncbi:MAG: nitric oxide reductase activation protein, partial [Lachnospiraceae bacterium]|nr:nitric oxide reductase activation protein [Lachnospiraceae bacterium]
MKERFYRMAEEQTEEHRLEIENRIKNLFWTISGDYTLDVRPDVKAFARSRSAALYDAMKQGAFARYFDSEEVALYMMKKVSPSAGEKPLMELARLCVDAAIYPKISKERPGTDDIRKKAFEDLLNQEEPVLSRTFFGQVKILMMKDYLGREPYQTSDAVRQTAKEIKTLEHAEDTLDIIKTMEKIYNTIFDQKFEEQHGNLEAVFRVSPMALANAAWQDCLTDEQMEEMIKKYLAGLGKEMMSLQIREEPKKQRVNPEGSKEKETDDTEIPDEASMQKVQEYVALNYGKNYLPPLEQER